MFRHIGFYRPVGLKHNAFLLFYTPCPQKHFSVLEKIYKRQVELFQLSGLGGPSVSPPMVFYTNIKFKNYKEIHWAVWKYLSKPNSCVLYQNNTQRRWPIVTVTDDMLNNLDLDVLIQESISAIEKTPIE